MISVWLVVFGGLGAGSGVEAGGADSSWEQPGAISRISINISNVLAFMSPVLDGWFWFLHTYYRYFQFCIIA